MAKAKEITFPYVVSSGSVTVRIYRTPSHGCECYTLSYYQDGVRKRPAFPTFAKAKTEAEVVSKRLGSSDSDVLLLRSADRASYLRARELADSIELPLERLAAEAVELRRILEAVTPVEAARDYRKRHPTKLPLTPVQTVVTELIAAKQKDKLSDRYIKALQWSLGKFAKRFRCNISVVSGRDIDQWLRESGLAPRTRNNLRQSVQTLMGFAKSQGYVSKDHDEMESVTVVKDGDGDIEVFTPSEMQELLGTAGKRLLPFLALGGFAGIRHAEIQRLDWKDIRFDDGFIEIRASKAKTASRRIVPLLDNLKAWLKPQRKEHGPVCSHQNMAFELRELVKGINQARRSAWAKANGKTEAELRKADATAAKQRKALGKGARRGVLPPPGAETAQEEGWAAFAWKHNALRHSFISYRVAQTNDVAKVSLEAGNSPQMIFKHYRELVRPADAKAWFSLLPDQGKAQSHKE